MKVVVIFDPAFHEKAGRAVWIIDTPDNRKWFGEQQDLDPNSAVFSMKFYPTIDAAIVHMVWNAQEHHPIWGQIEVIGVPLTPLIAADLRSEGRITDTPNGFVLTRA